MCCRVGLYQLRKNNIIFSERESERAIMRLGQLRSVKERQCTAYHVQGEQIFSILRETGGSDPGYNSDDSVKDPSYSTLEEIHAQFSKLSINSTSKAQFLILKKTLMGSR
ncbi:hypothetical protein RchiOBHm_Chr6g0283061 [Rosa chinensis]|uniref:Uncharacterized protein n=1 Tax=Rosa chinensis TaxID=74649 RepID=A0A2P6PTW6_ROSCH|nr:hypothetical protein RchiOBHm_Chr6g0283061 [Rosa chinensis]